MGHHRLARGFLIHEKMAIGIHCIRSVVSPSGGGRGDIEPGKVKVPRKVPGIGPGPQTSRGGPIHVSTGVDVPAPGLGRNIRSGRGR